MLSRFFLNNSNKKMLAPHAVDIAVTISSLIVSLYFTFAEPFDDIFLFVKSAEIQTKVYDPRIDRPIDRTTKRVNSRSLTKLLFRILQNSRKNDAIPTRDTVRSNHRMPFLLMHWWPLCSNEARANQLNSRPSIVQIGTQKLNDIKRWKSECTTKKNRKECRKIFIFERKSKRDLYKSLWYQ